MHINGLLILIFTTLLPLTQLFQQKVYIRKNANKFTFKEWESYRRGIRVMKERSKRNMYDPTGFYYQANLHGWHAYDGSTQANQVAKINGWHTCQHAQYFFLVWHRMFMYFYERLLRSASDDPFFALPYWDHYSPGESRSLPKAFRIPANESLNPLYLESGRCEAINKGIPLKGEVTDVSGALRSRFYSVDPIGDELNVCHSFGGGRVDRTQFVGNYGGLLDLDPHMMVHAYIGGPGGVMSDVCKSAQDPIFLPHHTQIDRIWESWLRSGGLMPNDNQFLNQDFDFFDTNGRRVRVRVRDFLNTTRLGYRYEEYVNTKRVVPTYITPKAFIDVNLQNRTNDLVLNSNKRSIVTQLEPKTKLLLNDLAKDFIYLSETRFTLQLAVDYIESGVYFDIYLNLDPESQPYNQSPYYINSMVLFDNKCVVLSQIRDNNTGNGLINFCFDVTKQLRQIVKNQYNLNGFVCNQFNLTFIGRDCADNYIDVSSERMLSFSSIYLVHIFN